MTSFVRTLSFAAHFLLSLTPRNSAMMLKLGKLSSHRNPKYVEREDKHTRIHDHLGLRSSKRMLFVKGNMPELILP